MTTTTIPPGPKARPVVGNLLDYSRDPLGFLIRCSRRYGDVVRLKFPGLDVDTYLISNPDHIEQVLVKNNRNFIKSRGTKATLRFLGDGLLTADGDFWRRQRRLAQPAFHRKRIDSYAEVMTGYTERMLEGWRAGEERDVHEDMMRLTLEIVAKTLFDTDISDGAEDVGHALEALMDQAAGDGSNVFLQMLPERVPLPGRTRFRQAIGRLEEIIYGIIEARRESGEDAGDLLSMLLHAEDEGGNRMGDEQLKNEVMTIILAGHETTALALSWGWYLLSENPEVEAKLHAELREILDGRTPELDDLPRLRYADMVVKEILRLYPPAWAVGREAVEDCAFGGYHVPAGTQIFISQYVVHHDPRHFEVPEAFVPERWEDGLEKRLPKYAYFPFGGGPRLCIGNSFAQMEAVLLLATIAQNFKLELVGGQSITPQPSVTLRPREGVRVRLRER